jgi:enterochelin esterase family protein
LARSWHEINEEGAPLVEPIEAEPGWSLLTFLWRDRDGDTRNVFIVGGPGHWSIREDVMRHVQGSDVWFRTYRVRSDFRGPYRLSPNDSLVDLDDVEDEDWPARSAGFQPDPLNPRRLVGGLSPSGLQSAGRCSDGGPASRYGSRRLAASVC